jgi:hypothetical protein
VLFRPKFGQKNTTHDPNVVIDRHAKNSFRTVPCGVKKKKRTNSKIESTQRIKKKVDLLFYKEERKKVDLLFYKESRFAILQRKKERK